MAAIWPTTLPDCPLLDGFSESTVDSRLITSVDAGLTKIRNRYVSVPTLVTERYILNKSQFLAFKDWWNNDTKRGAERFIKTNPITGNDVEYRFVDVYEMNMIGILYEINLSLEILPQ